MRKLLGIVLSSLLVATPAFADRTMYAPVRLAPTATAGTVLFADGTAAAPSMSFSADTNTGLFRSSADILSFASNAVTTMHYDGNGLVLGNSGTATSGPGTGVLRGTYASGTNIAGAPITIIGGRSTGNAAGGHIAFQTSAAGSSGSTANTLTERMRVTAAGDVVFGNGDSSASPADGIIRATNGSGSNINGGSLSLYGGNSTGSAGGGIVRFFTAPAGSSGSSSNTLTERMRITSDGDLLFAGTTQVIASNTSDGSDSKELWLSGGGTPGGFARGAHLRLQGNENAGNGSVILQSGENSSSTVTISGRGSSSSVIFQTNGGTERMRIDSAGNVGIGVSPARLLDVNGLSRFRDALYLASDERGRISWNSTDVSIRSEATYGISLQAAASERMRVKPNGQVRFIPLAADPAGAEDGDVYYNSTTNKLRVRAGGVWVDLH
jgi:hypothetical protein